MSTNGKPVNIAIVNYKTPDMTRKCLEHLYSNVDLNEVDIWVVDNDSQDDSVAYLRSVEWINLIERVPETGEVGRYSHAAALDCVLNVIETRYILCIHTDTFIFDGALVPYLVNEISRQGAVAAGVVEQVHRGAVRAAVRRSKYAVKRLSAKICGKTVKPPKTLLKSHCFIWDADKMKERGVGFSGGYNPGEFAQRSFEATGDRVVTLPTGRVFRYMHHVHSGTLVAQGKHSANKRRQMAYAHHVG